MTNPKPSESEINETVNRLLNSRSSGLDLIEQYAQDPELCKRVVTAMAEAIGTSGLCLADLYLVGAVIASCSGYQGLVAMHGEANAPALATEIQRNAGVQIPAMALLGIPPHCAYAQAAYVLMDLSIGVLKASRE